MNNKKYGVVHGRFQIFHNSHLEYVLAAKKLCDHLTVGITNPERSNQSGDAVDKSRFDSTANPFTFFERAEMIQNCLLDVGVSAGDFQVVPFPIEDPDRIEHYAPEGATHFLSIYDDWGRQKRERLESVGLKVHVLWERSESQKIHKATEIRNLIRSGEEFADQVPSSIAKWIVKNDLARKL